MAKVVWWLVGALIALLAGATIFLLLEGHLATSRALLSAIAILFVVPLVAALALRRGLQRVDSRASFLENLSGLLAVWSIVVVVGVLLFARGPLARNLEAVPKRHPNAGSSVHRATGFLAQRLTPPPATTATSAPVTSAEKHGAPIDGADAAKDASTSSIGAAANESTKTPALVARVEPCDLSFGVEVADFDRDGIDEILVACYENLVVLSVATEGAVVEILRFEPESPAPFKRAAGAPGSGDFDGDGALDALLCMTWITEGGGTRGGQAWYARGTGDAGFGEVVAIDRGPCNAIAMHDVTGDGKPELVIAQTGNPWQKEAPNGALAWSTREGKTFRQRGRVPTLEVPTALTFVDANGDGIDDVVVKHGWTAPEGPRPPILIMGSKTGLKKALPDASVPAPRARGRATANFDRDGVPDVVEIDEHYKRVSVLRTAPPTGAVVKEVSRPALAKP